MRHRNFGQIFYLSLFLLVLPLLFVISMPSSSFAVHDAPGAFAEDPAVNGCNHCHNMTIIAGNADGSNRLIAYSPLNTPNDRDPHAKRNSWGGTVTIMNGKEAGIVFTSTTTNYLNAWYSTGHSCPAGIPQGSSCAGSPGPFTLTVTKTGSGTGTVTGPVGTADGINCGTNCSEAYNSGTSVTLTETPDVGSAFGGWGGDCLFAGMSTTCTLTMNAAKNVTAQFNIPDTQAPTTPQNVQGTPDPNQCKIVLTWDQSSDNVAVTGYNIYRDLGTNPVGVSSLLTFTDTGLAQGTTYSYEVTAFDAAGNESARSSPPTQVTTTSGCTNVPIVMFRMSVDNAGNEGNLGSDWAAISGDGYRIAFHSDATNLVSGDTNSALDVFVRDRVANTTTRVSVDSSGTQGNGLSGYPSISRDGRYVAFWSLATNLVSGDTNVVDDIFVHDMVTGATERISVSSSGTQANGPSYPVTPLSADGRYVAFASAASNLVANDTNNQVDIFVRDRQLGTTERVSVDSSGLQGNGYSGNPSISADGRYVVFQSTATNLVGGGGDTNGVQDVFVHDRQTGETLRISVGSGGTQANDASVSSTRNGISADGQLIGFSSLATNLVSGDTNGVQDAFVYNRVTNTVERISVDSNGVQGNGFSMLTSLSSDGHYVGFNSQSTNLVINDTNGVQDVFVHNRLTHKTERISVDSSGIEGNNISYRADLSSDGRYAAFSSDANNLILGDTNGVRDVFVRDRGAPALKNISSRVLVQTGANVAIGGFIITGTEPKTVLIRARGPSMSGAPFNIQGTLSNPSLQLYSFAAGAFIAQNDDWQTTNPQCDSPALSCGGAAQITATGKDPCQPNPGQTSPPPGCTQESAILITLPPGNYGAIMSGVNNGTGVGLVEVFDVDTLTMSKLGNISTRALVLTDANVAIGGFIIGGDNLKKVLIRGRGPSMSGAPFNFQGTLSNPFLRLYSFAAGTYIAENNDWQTTLALCAQSGYECGGATEITATGKDPCQPNPGQTSPPPGCTQESAILITLPPGNYGAILSGVNAGTGLGLIEVFEIP